MARHRALVTAGTKDMGVAVVGVLHKARVKVLAGFWQGTRDSGGGYGIGLAYARDMIKPSV